MRLSIIIPTYNEAATIGKLVSYLLRCIENAEAEIIVSDGGSEDDTLQLANEAGATAVISPGKGRASQMNHGASRAQGDVLYFVHADCYPPNSFVQDIRKAVKEGYGLGRYRTRFDSSKPILKLNAWVTRFDLFICMGGDQTLFVKKELFQQCNGFKEEMKIMEEYDFCTRARKIGRYKIMQKDVLVSARKYETNSWLKVQRANMKVVQLFRNGASQDEMVSTYKKMLHYRKSAF
jgi:rSAM/selenodomain-associated transferase 2